jgi:hypothetical protein
MTQTLNRAERKQALPQSKKLLPGKKKSVLRAIGETVVAATVAITLLESCLKISWIWEPEIV